MRKLLRRLIQWLPYAVKSRFLRSQINLSDPEGELIIKLATTKSEYEQAFKLLHEAYVARGFMKPHNSQMRVTAYHALPTTITVIAVKGKEIVGTGSIIRNNPLGLPIEDVVDLSKLREKNNDRIAEISSLAIKRGHRGDSGKILFPLTKYMKHMCQDLLKVSEVVIAVNPKMVDFYRSILLFKPTKALSIKNYGFANGAPAAILTLNFEQAYHDNYTYYHRQEAKKNLFAYMYSKEAKEQFYNLKNYRAPVRRYNTTSYLPMSPEFIKYFFIEKTNIFNSLKPEARRELQLLLNDDALKGQTVVPLGVKQRASLKRRERRHGVNCRVRVHLPNEEFMEGYMLNLSSQGACMYLNSHKTLSVEIGEKYTVDVQVSDFEVAQIIFHPRRGLKNYLSGQALETDKTWQKLIKYLDSIYFSIDGERKKAS